MTNKTTRSLLILVAFATTVADAQDDYQAEWQRMSRLGLQHETALDLYAALRESADDSDEPIFIEQLPDWSGLWTHSGVTGLVFSPGPFGQQPTFTPAAAAMLDESARRAAEGVVYDENLSQCGPPGFPRWLTIPFLREFIVRPEQTWLSSETVNNVRRIYTDGRDHPPEEERYPLYYGDSIGFWDGQKLVIHTNQLMSREMGRNGLRQSEQMETVEIWEKTSDESIRAHVWVYDAAIIEEPWYALRHYTQVDNPASNLRMRYWHCGENDNNDVFQTEEGSTQYFDFTFGGGSGR